MQDIHPHWRATDEEVPVTIRETPAALQQLTQQKSISRRPAAIVGITLVVGAGFLFFRDSDALQGQVVEPSMISITIDGFDPPSISVSQGETITFTNDSPIPQVIESTTLCSLAGYCLYTDTLFPGESENFTITQEFIPGSYPYLASGIPDLAGEIVIEGTQPNTQPVNPIIPEPVTPEPQFQPVTTSIEQSITNSGPFNTAPLNNAPRAPVFPNDILANAAGDQFVAQNSIPQNPYAIGSDRQHPFDASGEPIEEAFEDTPHPGAPRPISQPETGAGLWIVILLSIGAILFVTKRTLQREIVYR